MTTDAAVMPEGRGRCRVSDGRFDAGKPGGDKTPMKAKVIREENAPDLEKALNQFLANEPGIEVRSVTQSEHYDRGMDRNYVTVTILFSQRSV